MTQQTERKVLVDLISDIVNLPNFDTPEKRIFAFASLYQRIFAGDSDISAITKLGLTAQAAFDDPAEMYAKALKVNARIHVMEDDEGDTIFNQETGALSDKWADDMELMAVVLAELLPDAFLPCTDPVELHTPFHANEVPLINTSPKYQYQPEKYKPNLYASLNALHSQGYKLNSDMAALRNLPIAIDAGRNYGARQMIVKNTSAFAGEFFFSYTLDYRGRAYARSLFINPQGDSFSKAFIDSSVSKPLGRYGFGALAIHFANCSGHDKISLVDRVKWANTDGYQKAKRMMECDGNWTKIAKLIEDPKHCFEEYTAAMEFWRASRMACRATYHSSLITHQDATNSGFQFGAALTGCRDTAELVNITAELTKHDKPADLYGKMSEHMLKFIELSQDEYLAQWKPVINRNFCKKPIMTTGYGAGIETIMNGSKFKAGSGGVLGYMIELQKTKPQYTDLVSRHEELRPCVESSLEATASAMLHVTATMQEHADRIMLIAEQIEWYTPDGLRVVQCKRDNSERQVTLSNGAVTYVRAKGKDPVDTDRMVTALSPNFIHSIDAQMLRTAALKAQEAGVAFTAIHDSFGTHAATFFELHSILKESFVETMEYPWYSKFCETNGVTPNLPRLGDYDFHEALEATYIFS